MIVTLEVSIEITDAEAIMAGANAVPGYDGFGTYADDVAAIVADRCARIPGARVTGTATLNTVGSLPSAVAPSHRGSAEDVCTCRLCSDGFGNCTEGSRAR